MKSVSFSWLGLVWENNVNFWMNFLIMTKYQATYRMKNVNPVSKSAELQGNLSFNHKNECFRDTFCNY